MKILIVFNDVLGLPVEKNEILQTYGLALDKEKWNTSPYRWEYLCYVRVVSRICKDGFKSEDGMEFEKDGYKFYYGDLTWISFERTVEECGVQYAIVEDCRKLEEGDCHGEYFTNKDKWEEILKREGLEWRR